jgi:hypothetical protein
LLQKTKGYREMKKKLIKEKKSLEQSIEKQISVENLETAKLAIVKMYLARINELLAGEYPAVYSISDKAKELGIDGLDQDEKELCKLFSGSTKQEQSLSRLDKFLHGAAKEFNDMGYQSQVGPLIEQRAKAVAIVREAEELRKDDLIRAKGLDPDKLRQANIDGETRCKWGDEILQSYDLLSEYPRETFVSDRVGPAPDGLWQYVPRPGRTARAVMSKMQAVYDVDSSRSESVFSSLVVGLAHEVEGHVLQNDNMKNVGLRLFKKIGGDRRGALSEGGAMFIQSKLTEEFFGYKGMAHPHYIRAMQTKLEGKGYPDCVKSFYDSSVQEIKGKYNLENGNEREAFLKECKKLLPIAINRAKRLFRGVDLQAKSPFLTSSKDTVYLEQEILMEELEKRGLIKFAFIAGLNLDNVATLLKLGLLDASQIKEPKYETRKIWERIKHNYTPDLHQEEKN